MITPCKWGQLLIFWGAKVTCVGLGNTYTKLLGYVVWVQVDGVQGYDKDQIALVIPDASNFAVRVPVTLETPTISCIVNVMKDKEIDALVMPWANARVAHLLLVCRMTAVKVGNGTVEECGPENYDQVMFTPEHRDYRGFFFPCSAGESGKGLTRGCINVMAQALWTEDGSLPQGLTMQNTYTELWQGSKKAVMVVRNSTAYLQTLWKKALMARAVLATPLPKSPVEALSQEGRNEPQNPCAQN